MKMKKKLVSIREKEVDQGKEWRTWEKNDIESNTISQGLTRVYKIEFEGRTRMKKKRRVTSLIDSDDEKEKFKE